MGKYRLEQAIDFLRKDSPAEAEYYENLKTEEEAFCAAQATLAEVEKWKKELKKDESLIGRVHAHRILCEKLAQRVFFEHTEDWWILE